MAGEYKMRKQCLNCGSDVGEIRETGAQDCVFCVCGKFQYNAPRIETGKEVRTVSRVHNGIKPNQRARIIERDNGRCVNCGKDASMAVLHAGHIISVVEGLAAGFTEVELNDDENLVTLCDECNLGAGREPQTLRFIIRAYNVRRRFLRKGGA